MIYFFHHHELPTILQQARIQLLLQRNQHGGMHGAGLNANLNLNLQGNIPQDLPVDEPQGTPQGGAEATSGTNSDNAQAPTVPNTGQGQVPTAGPQMTNQTIWQFHLGPFRRVASHRYPPGAATSYPTSSSNVNVSNSLHSNLQQRTVPNTETELSSNGQNSSTSISNNVQSPTSNNSESINTGSPLTPVQSDSLRSISSLPGSEKNSANSSQRKDQETKLETSETNNGEPRLSNSVNSGTSI